MSRRRALMEGKDSDILFEWTPNKGLTNVDVVASSGETPRYTLLDDAIRLYGPNNSQVKWSGLALKDPLDPPVDVAIIEVYYKNVQRNSTKAISVVARGYTIGTGQRKLGYASVSCETTTSTSGATHFTVRGANTIRSQDIALPYLSGVVKCKINHLNNTVQGIYPDGSVLSDSLGVDTSALWLCAVETQGDTRYADITRIVIRRA